MPDDSQRTPRLFVVRIPRPPRPTLFPYTTLFRSRVGPNITISALSRSIGLDAQPIVTTATRTRQPPSPHLLPSGHAPPRSEEHTSELQSRENLVCRLLLEKKNDQRRILRPPPPAL